MTIASRRWALAVHLAILAGANPGSSSASPFMVATQAAASARPVLDAGRYKFFLGVWSGSGTFQRTGKPVHSELIATAAAAGEAIELRYRELPPNKFAYVAAWSLDTIAGGPVMLMAGNNSGGARLFRAVGTDPDRLVFLAQPDLHAWFGLERMTFRRIDDSHLEIAYDFSRDGSAWATGDVQIFTRQATP